GVGLSSGLARADESGSGVEDARGETESAGADRIAGSRGGRDRAEPAASRDVEMGVGAYDAVAASLEREVALAAAHAAIGRCEYGACFGRRVGFERSVVSRNFRRRGLGPLDGDE